MRNRKRCLALAIDGILIQNESTQMHIAVICPEVPGHTNSMTALALELQRCGHAISWIGILDGREFAARWGFRSIALGEQEFPLGYIANTMKQLGRLTGWQALQFTLDQYRRAIDVGLRETPSRLQGCGVDALIADESAFHARSLAETLEIPWVTISSALPMHPDRDLPPPGLPWKFGRTPYHRLRNRLGYTLARFVMRRIARVIYDYRAATGLPPYDFFRGNASRLATIAQITREFDFPRSEVPDWFHYVGSLQKNEHRSNVAFPFDRLHSSPPGEQRPLIYASMGTLQNQLYPIFRNIAEACADETAQLVISLGGGGRSEDLGALPGQPIVVEYAPQLELIARAVLVITHAGMNTVTESIACGVPMLAIPVTNDQPAVATRIARAGCGEMLSLKKASTERIRLEVRRLLRDDRYTANARKLAAANDHAGGLPRAVKIIERVLDGANGNA